MGSAVRLNVGRSERDHVRTTGPLERTSPRGNRVLLRHSRVSHLFELDPSQTEGLVRLQLGQVKHVAEVHLNGQPLGIVWTAPWSVDLTDAVVAGTNELRIQVTNVWVNRLIGDAGLPKKSD